MCWRHDQEGKGDVERNQFSRDELGASGFQGRRRLPEPQEAEGRPPLLSPENAPPISVLQPVLKGHAADSAEAASTERNNM